MIERRTGDPDLEPAAIAAPHDTAGDYRRPLARLADGAAHAAAEVLALAAPVDCVCCGAEDLALCGGCERQVRLLMRRPFRAEAPGAALMDVDGSVLLPVVAAGAYRAELAQAVLSFKSHGQGQLAEVLSQGLGRAIQGRRRGRPGAAARSRSNQQQCLPETGFQPGPRAAGQDTADPGPAGEPGLRGTTVHALRKTGSGRAARVGMGLGHGTAYRLPGVRGAPGGQKGLGRGDRAQRVRGSMRVRRGLFAPEVSGRPCIIVDDVLTTGATVAEAARALRAAGAVVRGAVVVAATRPPGTLDFGAADPRGGRGTAVSRKKINQKRMNKRGL